MPAAEGVAIVVHELPTAAPRDARWKCGQTAMKCCCCFLLLYLTAISLRQSGLSHLNGLSGGELEQVKRVVKRVQDKWNLDSTGDAAQHTWKDWEGRPRASKWTWADSHSAPASKRSRWDPWADTRSSAGSEGWPRASKGTWADSHSAPAPKRSRWDPWADTRSSAGSEGTWVDSDSAPVPKRSRWDPWANSRSSASPGGWTQAATWTGVDSAVRPSSGAPKRVNWDATADTRHAAGAEGTWVDSDSAPVPKRSRWDPWANSRSSASPGGWTQAATWTGVDSAVRPSSGAPKRVNWDPTADTRHAAGTERRKAALTEVDQDHSPDTPSSTSPTRAPSPILLVLDLDGVLCDRASKTGASQFLRDSKDFKVNGFLTRRRPHFDEFVQFLQANKQYFQVMVWSSAAQKNVAGTCHKIFKKGFLAKVWGRERCQKYWLQGEARAEALRTATKTHVAGVHYELTKKNLAKVWASSNGRWGPHNTLLIDNCAVKASIHPLNAIQPHAFDGTLCSSREEYDDDTELLRLIEYLKGCRGVPDIQAHIQTVKYCPTRELPTIPVSSTTEQPPAASEGQAPSLALPPAAPPQ
eukprot:EG_transcript_6061